MMAAASEPMSIGEAGLRAEVERLQEENIRLNKELNVLVEFTAQRFAEVNKRLKQLEGGRKVESGKVFAHLEALHKWLTDHEDTRKGITYEEAARLLNLTPVRICQMRDAIDRDGRMKVSKSTTGKHRMRIVLA